MILKQFPYLGQKLPRRLLPQDIFLAVPIRQLVRRVALPISKLLDVKWNRDLVDVGGDVALERSDVYRLSNRASHFASYRGICGEELRCIAGVVANAVLYLVSMRARLTSSEPEPRQMWRRS